MKPTDREGSVNLTRYELDFGEGLPDPGDRHVLAAAIRCGAEIIVTFNFSDFPPESLEPYEIEAMHPDDFIVNLIDISPKAVCKALETQRCRLKNPPKTPEEHLNTLLEQGLAQTVTLLRELCYEF
ncbi:PIN domain-containing protein [Laspinema sp. A4]|uniref:PIN domain-containing protein n=1 Tax=Laspinema sp. D2d TaxID=2953686 RepID=UPI0021BAAE18|nr:PIN domain-containing protein [Laspinema sp. D2d]MCT7982886.1 PIN domain-containing protein [Laspinema sp. D2d]